MFDAIKNLFGRSNTDYKKLVEIGGVVVDVRSKAEFNSGHVKGSINIPLDKLEASLSQLKDKNKPVITCCASGMRSGIAKKILMKNGYEEVYNGGGWVSLNGKINK